ncbi:SH3 domain-containing protein [Oryzifoliimicrobium ureilyticus]|uniref:SH3 domain-containing protein n=1 Tax=Oryzifoliimicrobium ureilyticus TaxID=3113724 RepID=UPI0030760B19
MLKRTLLKIAAAGALLLAPAIAEAAEGFATANVNMRAGPSTAYPAVVVIPVGAPLDIHGCLAEVPWCDVSFYGGRGWVAGRYVQVAYRQRRVYVGPEYYRPLGIPTIQFSVGNYWDRYYRDRDFYRERDRWRRSPPRPDWDGPPPRFDRDAPPPNWDRDDSRRRDWDRNRDRDPRDWDRDGDRRRQWERDRDLDRDRDGDRRQSWDRGPDDYRQRPNDDRQRPDRRPPPGADRPAPPPQPGAVPPQVQPQVQTQVQPQVQPQGQPERVVPKPPSRNYRGCAPDTPQNC